MQLRQKNVLVTRQITFSLRYKQATSSYNDLECTYVNLSYYQCKAMHATWELLALSCNLSSSICLFLRILALVVHTLKSESVHSRIFLTIFL